jgi:hypothetical protein
MSIIQGIAKSGGSTSFYDFPIGDSLRFDGTSSYLSRTPSTAGNRRTWTWSGWVKFSNVSSTIVLFGISTGAGFYKQFSIMLNSQNIKVFSDTDGTAGSSFQINLVTSAVFRDTSAWYHLVVSIDSTQSTSTNRASIYINGVNQYQNLSTSTYPSLNQQSEINNTSYIHGIGLSPQNGSGYHNGYMANIQLIDGQALDPYFFGEFKDNIWVPYNAFSTANSGTATASDGDTATDSYGTNGFHLTFEDGIESLPVGGYTGNQNAFRDKSHNTNHWKTN